MKFNENSERFWKVFNGGKAEGVPRQEMFFSHPGIAEHFGQPPTNPTVSEQAAFIRSIGWGSISCCWLGWSPGGVSETASDGTEHYAGGSLETLEQLEGLRLSEEYLEEAVAGMKRMARAGHNEGLCAHTWITSCIHALATGMGLENFAVACYDRPDFIKEAMEIIEEHNRRMVKLAAGHVDFIAFDGDCAFKTGLMMSPDMFREFWYEPTRKTCELLKTLGIPYMYHTDGKVDEIYPLLIELGFSAAHGVEAAANDLAEVKKKFGKDITLIGNMDVVDLTRKSIPDIKEEVREMLEKGSPGGRYVAACNTVVREYIPVENYLAMIEVIDNFIPENCEPLM